MSRTKITTLLCVFILVAWEASTAFDNTKTTVSGSRYPPVVMRVVGHPIAKLANPVIGIFIPGGNGSSCILEDGGLFTIREHSAEAEWGWYEQPAFTEGSSASCASGFYLLHKDEHGLRNARRVPAS